MNTQDKARFFAANYGGTAICKGVKDGRRIFTKDSPQVKLGWASLYDIFNGHNHEHWAVLLTPLDRIAHEHAIEVAKMLFCDEGEEPDERTIKIAVVAIRDGFGGMHCASWRIATMVIDYLRKQRYAIDFDGHTVHEMESDGWLKLKEV